MEGHKRSGGYSLIFSILFAFIGAFFAGVTFYIFNRIYDVQSTPYLDEVFHIPQAEKYCKWLFKEWDPKITTFPGLYLLSIGVLTPLSSLFGLNFCSVYALRFINYVACLATFYIVSAIQQKLQTSKKDPLIPWLDMISNINLATFPVLYFFTFLYYTDATSTCLVLLMYLLHLDSCTVLAALIGAIAVVVRQTNVIWVFFFAAETIVQVLHKHTLTNRRKIPPNIQKSSKYIYVLANTVMSTWRGGFNSCKILAQNILRYAGAYCLVCVSFVAFVFWNGSLVIGDKEAHQAVINFPQLFYLILFNSLFCAPFFVSNMQPFCKICVKHWKKLLALSVVCCIIIYTNTLVHPYLLADNRHYTFYLWKRVYERHYLLRYLLVPVYLYGGFSMYQVLKNMNFAFQLNYFLCVVLCLVPQRLLEFRYFIIPYYILRLNITPRLWWQLVLEFILFTSVNIFTIYIFLTRTFYWSGTDELQRIMW